MRALGGLLPILVLVALARLVTWRSVFLEDGVAPYDADPHFRLRQIQLIAHHFPDRAPEDPYVLGAQKADDPTLARKEPWLHPSMFFLAWGLAGFEIGDEALRRGAMFVPVIWGVVTVVLAFGVAWRISGVFAGILAALFAGLSMPLLWRTTLGALDNHMVEGAVFLVLLLGAAAIRGISEAGGMRRAGVALGVGLIVGGCGMISYWTALGALLVTGAYSLGLALFPAAGKEERPGHAPVEAAALAIALTAAGLMNLLLRNPVSGVCLGGGGVYLAGQVLVWTRGGQYRFWIWAALVAGVGAAVWVVAPGAVDQLVVTARVAFHLSKDPGFTEQYYAAIRETAATPLGELYTRYSFLVFLTPVFFLMLAWRARRDGDFMILAVCVMAIALLLPSLRNSRFSHMAAAALAPVIGWGLSGIVQGIARGMQRGGRWRIVPPVLKGVFVAGMILGFLPYVQHNARVHAMRPDTAPAFREAFRWMKENTPRDERFWSPGGPPPYRVMAMWDLGWPMLDLAQRVPVANNAGEGVREELDYFFRAGPEEALKIAAQQQTRYVLASGTQGRATTAFRLFRMLPGEVLADTKKPEHERAITRTYLASVHARLYIYDGGAHTDVNGVAPALGRYRLLYESVQRVESPLGSHPVAKLFELVAGARAVGRAVPGAVVTASLDLATNTGRRFTYVEEMAAGADGLFSCVLPYPSCASSGTTKPLGPWRIASGGRQAVCDVPEELALHGGTIEVPDTLR